MNNPNQALQNIIAVCESSKEITHRTLRVMDIAMEGLGFPANTRSFKIERLRIAGIERSRQKSVIKHLTHKEVSHDVQKNYH